MNSLKSFRVGEWRVEPTLNQIFRDSDPEQAVRLEPKAMQVLVHLAERAGEVVDKDSVIRDVWEGAFVTNEVLTNAIWELSASSWSREVTTPPRTKSTWC